MIDLIDRVSTYLPLIATIVLLLASDFVSGIFNFVPLGLMLAIMASSFLGIAVFLERRVAGLHRAVVTLTERQDSFLRASVPSLTNISLAQGFEIMAHRNARWRTLRVYAVSSQMILNMVRLHEIEIDSCQVLVRSCADAVNSQGQQLARDITLAEQTWHGLVQEGRIRHLVVRHYDFTPTEYECLVDEDWLLLGLYDIDRDGYAGVKVRPATLINGASPAGRGTVEAFSTRFDNLFEASRPDCEDAQTGTVAMRNRQKKPPLTKK
jgi:hypothetical protein